MAKKIEMIVIPERNLEQLTEVMEHFYLSSEIDDDNTVMQLARGCQQVGWPEGAVAIYEYWLINHSDHVVSLFICLRFYIHCIYISGYLQLISTLTARGSTLVVRI